MINFNRLVQPSITKNEKNISYILPSFSRNDAKNILSENLSGGGVFGIEAHRSTMHNTFTFFSPPHFKTNWTIGERDPLFSELTDKMKNVTYLQIYTEKASLFPIDMNGTDSFWETICSICPKHINAMYQLLLVFRQDNWKERLQEQYDDYLNGIEQPSNTKLFRRLQRNISGRLDGLLKWEYKHSPIPEVERKLKENGFRYNIRLVIYGGTKHERNKVVNSIRQELDKSSYINNWSINKNSFIGDTIECIKKRKMDNIGKQQVLSMSEILPFIMTEQITHIEQPSIQLITSKERGNKKKSLTNPFEILPMGDGLKEVSGKRIAEKFIGALKELKGIHGEMVAKNTQAGSTLIKITFDLPKGLKYSELTKKDVIEDLQTQMGMKHLRITQGEEIGEIDVWFPLEERQKAFLRNYIDTPEFKEFAENNPLPYLVGINEIGRPIFQCLNKNRHLLIAGTTGSGKSVWVNQLILTLLMIRKPEELMFFMIDVKQVELPIYEKFPHVQSVITDADESIQLLSKLIKEMNRRYTLFKDASVKDIGLYNKKHPNRTLPYVVCVIDEYAELSLRNKDVHDLVQSLVQLSRASGIHLIIATQRPSVDVIPSVIKSNLPCKVGFRCSNDHSYRTFLNSKPPFTLLGDGDGTMSFEGQMEEHVRFQGCLIVDDPDKLDLESQLINRIAENISDDKIEVELPEVIEEEEVTELDRLRELIMTTGETRVSQLRDIMKVNINRLNDLMKELVDEGFLEKGESRQQGYKIVNNRGEIE